MLSKKASSLAVTEQMVLSQPTVVHSSDHQLEIIGVNSLQGSRENLPQGWQQA